MRYRHTPPLNKIAIVLLSLFSAMGVVQADSTSSNLPTIDVYGNHDTAKVRDQAGYDAIYDANYSSDYAGSKVINAYRGTNPADLLRNFTGVYSGDARNGGAIDPNIRGIQGAGRVPVTVDGTEQAMVVSKGYNGASNQSYVDPMLIGSIRIIKDGGYTGDAGFKTGVGGGMAIRTIDAEDVLRGRLGFGGEIRLESSSNAAKFYSPINYNGWTVAEAPKYKPCLDDTTNPYNRYTCVYLKRAPIKTTADALNFLSGHDFAGRIALAYAKENWSVMGAYAYRQRGNYYAGKNHSKYYGTITNAWNLSGIMKDLFPAGAEIFNTAARTSSYLLKAKVQPDSAQTIDFGFMRVNSQHGQITPSQLYKSTSFLFQDGIKPVAPQIPLSEIHINAYHLNYKLHPQHNKWVDLKLGLWRTDSNGFGENRMGSEYVNNEDNLIADRAKLQFKDTRYGVNLSNKMQLLDRVAVTVFGSVEHRKLVSKSPYYKYTDFGSSPLTAHAGRKTEGGIGVDFNIQPTDRLTVNLGAKFSAYRVHNDALKRLFADGGATRYLVIKNALSTVKPGPDGKLHFADDSCYNGTLTGAAQKAQCTGIPNFSTTYISLDKPILSYKDKGWAPFASLAYQLTDSAKVYARYNESIHYPGIAETSTVGAFVIMLPYQRFAPGAIGQLLPEHSHAFELGYTQNLLNWLPNAELADFKVSYYQNHILNPMDRMGLYTYDNFDSLTTKGLELSARYDGGQFFTNLGVSYLLSDKICSENIAVGLSHIYSGDSLIRVPTCMKGGFPWGFLANQIPPKLSTSLNLGTRLLDRKLELSTRITYYTKYRNKDYDSIIAQQTDPHNTDIWTSGFEQGNVPFGWDNTLIVDAYARYHVNKYLDAEFSITNLTDQYYLDPANRTLIPAPGRVLKLSLTGKF